MKTKNTASTYLNLVSGVLMTTFLLLSSCTKPREATFRYGAGENLLDISDYDGKEFDLQTEDEISQINVTKSAKLQSQSTSILKNGVVNYTTKAELMDKVPFVGKKNTIYKIRYELTDNYLKIFKIAAKKDLSITEQTYAVADGSSGMVKVPLLGYPIKGYYKVTRDRNDLNEQTSTLIEKEETTKETATHFKINRQGKEIFKAIQKIDTFPASFFDGDWYYSETISASNYASQSGYGYIVSQDLMGNEAAKVRLKKTENGLQFFNLNIDDKLIETLNTRDENKVTVVSIPVKWKNYKQSDRGNDTALSEEEDNTGLWNTRQYVEMDLASATSPLAESGQFEINDMQVEEGYFSFTTLSKSTNLKVIHSFLKAKPRTYKPKPYITEDQSVFGLFTSRQNTLSGRFDQHYQKDANKIDLVNRYNPESATIEYHLSDNSPDWTEAIAIQAVSEWNKAFKKAGLKTEIIFKKDRVALGDLRYNVINLISQPDGNFSWGGFGPSLNDPQTGERIASTANVNVNDYLNFAVRIMRNMADSKIGLLDKAYILGDFQLTGDINTVRAEDGTTSKAFNPNRYPKLSFAMQKRSDKIGFNLIKLDPSAKKGFTPFKVEKLNKKSALKYKPEENIGASFGNIINEVNNSCPEVKKYHDGLTNISQKASSADEYALYLKCAKAISPSQIVAVLLHEMGHNLGLRHNFYGSVDAANFISKTLHTSSIMEYTTANEEAKGLGIGPYDIAAIRWAYNNEIETTQGQLVKLDQNKSIRQNLQEKNISAKKYMYCTDENVDIYPTDPMCARSDAGTTPQQIVMHYITDYNTDVALNNQRRGRTQMNEMHNLAMYRSERFFIPIKSFYDMWRTHLARFAGEENKYLEKYNKAQYLDLLKRMQSDATYGPIYNAYYPAAQLAYKFFRDLAFLPDKYCVTKRPLPELLQKDGRTTATKLYSLNIIKNEIYGKKQINVYSCSDAAVTEYLKQKNVTLIGQGGYFADDQYADLDVLKQVGANVDSYNLEMKPEQIGMGLDRAVAFLHLSDRFGTSWYNNTKLDLYPNFFDEPTLREDLETRILNRILKGVDVNTVKPSVEKDEKFKYSKNFSNEGLTRFFYARFKEAMAVPGRFEVSNQRLTRFETQWALNDSKASLEESLGRKIEITNVLGKQYYATETSDIAFTVIKTLRKINDLRENKPLDADVVQKASNLFNLLATPESLKTYSVDDFEKFLAAYIKLLDEAGKRVDGKTIKQYLEHLVLDKYGYFNSFKIEQIKKLGDNEEAIAKYNKKPLLDVVNEFNIKHEKSNKELDEDEKIDLLTKEDFLRSSGAKSINALNEKRKKEYELYEIDKDELDTQADLLSNYLTD